MTKIHNNSIILIVDDNPDNLSVLFELLSAYHFEVLVAEDGESALSQAEYARPDLILLDILMPNMDGFMTCQRLKANPSTQQIPVIFMSALTETEEKVKGFQLGGVDFVTKPLQHEEVLARINTHLTLTRLKQELADSKERLARILESAMDAIITFDQEGCITLFNQAAERVFRSSTKDVLGQSIEQFLSHGLRELVTDYLQKAEHEIPPQMWIPEGNTAKRNNGDKFSLEGSLSRVKASGQIHFTIILRDIEERKKAEEERQQLQGMNRYLQTELQAVSEVDELVASSESLLEVMQSVKQVAPTDATALIIGETGTGKELIARAIHKLSGRKSTVMVKLNCAAIPAGVMESELFGHEKGAFTGAVARKLGRFELADGGTLFLDEVGELPLDLQAKLLRLLQEGEFERVGGTRTLTADVRIIAATNRDLAKCVKESEFRADLFYRLNVFPIVLPPLRQRKEDIPELIQYFLHKFATRYAKPIPKVSKRILDSLVAYDWPGNVRELQHVIERSIILTQGAELAFQNSFQQPDLIPQAADYRIATLEEIERDHIVKTLENTQWRVSGKGGAAELLGLKPTTLESRMKRLGINRRN